MCVCVYVFVCACLRACVRVVVCGVMEVGGEGDYIPIATLSPPE